MLDDFAFEVNRQLPTSSVLDRLWRLAESDDQGGKDAGYTNPSRSNTVNPNGVNGADGAEPDNIVEVFRKHSPRMVRNTLFKVGNFADAEELVQEAFLKREKYLADGNKIDKEAAFLNHTLRWLIADHWRKKDRQKELIADREINDNDLLLSSDGDPVSDEQLAEAIAQLPVRQQEVIVKHFLDSYTGNEIAEVQGTSAATVSRLKNLALENLKIWLNEH